MLSNISFELNAGDLLAVAGPIGSGKSSLLMSILNEMPEVTGQIDIKGTIFYVAQEPWLYPATLKENILFGKPFDKKKFNRVIDSCFLLQVNLTFIKLQTLLMKLKNFDDIYLKQGP